MAELSYAWGVRRKVIMGVAAGVTLAEAIVVAQRRGSLFAANTVVRCRSGHLYTTFWVPGGSLKAIRLGWWRLQRCPVGKHWSIVTPAKYSELTEDEKTAAAQRHDVRIP